jgi:hypothetical protein
MFDLPVGGVAIPAEWPGRCGRILSLDEAAKLIGQVERGVAASALDPRWRSAE